MEREDKGVHLRGVVGAVMWGYYTAARVEGYTVVRMKQTRRWSLTATVMPGTADVLKMRQKPLRFVAPFVVPAADGKPAEKRKWEWLVEDADITRGVLTARLEPLGTF